MENLIPLFAIFFIVGAPIIAFVTMRVLAHRERIELIKRGYIPTGGFGKRGFKGGFTAPPPPWNAQNIGGPIPPVQDPQAEYYDANSAQRALRSGIITTSIGFAIFIGLSFIGYNSHGGAFGSPTIEPGPWLLGGLIPMFIGIAQLIIALLSGARFGLPIMPPGQADYAAPQPPPNVAGTYYDPPHPQPRATTYEELKRPTPPPDIR